MKKIYLFIFAITFLTTSVFAQFTKLYDFTAVPNGTSPYGSLITDGTFLYGMTKTGGINDKGTVFKIKQDGSMYAKLFDFDSINGANPMGSLFSDGTFLYGMARNGGTANLGVIFKIKPDGTGFLKLFDFTTTNGTHPNGSFISDGTFLYGMTQSGGTGSCGTIIKIKPDGSGFAKIHDFNYTNGGYPNASLVLDGLFVYGLTEFGGANGFGVIFKMKTDGTAYSTLMDFAGISNGSDEMGSLYSDGTFLYGVTSDGGTNDLGTIFKIKQDGTMYTKLFDFSGTADGMNPRGSLISDGTFLYGLTYYGSLYNNGGIFKIKTDGTGFVNLMDFYNQAGCRAYGDLVASGTSLYGLTSGCGLNTYGTIFKFQLPAVGIIENAEATDINIYPNPSFGQTTISFNREQKNSTITITDVLGKMIRTINFTGNELLIDTEGMQKGVYYLRVIDENKKSVNKKIVIQ
jgi:uncharacterized repeat protein (TIGR03803 family)